MKLVQSIGVWGDSVMKGVVYDENKSKYTLLSENGADKASRKLGLRLFNRSRMGCTVTKGLQLLKKDLQRPEAACDAALIEFGGNDCDYDWAQVAAHPEQDHQPKTPLPLFIAQLRDMIDLVRQKGMQPVMMTLPPLHAQRYFDFFTRNGLSGDTFSSLRSCPSQMAKPESSAMTIQVLTKVWVILKSPSRGILVWMVYRIFAPFSSIYSCSPPSSRGCTADASAGAGSSSTAMSTGSCGGVSGLYFPVIWR